MGMGAQMGITIGLGVYAGIKLDEKYPNEHKMWTIICSLSSVAIALYLVLSRVIRNSK